jgi:hypothetical protein
VGQLVGHLTARIGPRDRALATRLLPLAALAVFDAMPVADRRHGVDVVQRLLERGIDDRDVLAAALLHDAGKGRTLRLWHRVGGVLLAAIAPRLLDRLASPDPVARNPWYVFVHHAEISAEVAARAGAPARAVAFIRGAPAPGDEALATELHAADEAS